MAEKIDFSRAFDFTASSINSTYLMKTLVSKILWLANSLSVDEKLFTLDFTEKWKSVWKSHNVFAWLGIAKFGNINVIFFSKTPQNNLLFHTASEYIYHVLMGSTSCHLLIRKNRIWEVLKPRVGGSAGPTFAWMITTRTVSISENGNCLPMMSFHSTTAFGCINLRGLLSAVSHGN